MRRRITAALVAVLAALLWVAGPAAAASPPPRHSATTGQSDALGDQRGAPQAAVGKLYARDRIELSDVYIRSFSGLPATAGTSTAPPPATSPGLPGGPDVAIIAGVAVILLGGAVLISRRRARGSGGPRDPGRGRPGPQAPPGPSTPELAAQAAHALVATDDAIRTSDQELGFARARFGDHAAAPFATALTSARRELAEGFRLRQLIDDDIPATEATRRQYLTQIAGHCAEASRFLDEQSGAFDRLQDLEARAPQVLAEVDAHAAQQTARLDRSRELLARLSAKYSPAAVATISANPDQADERLVFARSGLDDARTALAAGQAAEAAVFLQAAEAAADQATDLLSAIGHLEAELTQAASALPAALREIDADIAEAAALPAGRDAGHRAALVARARAAADQMRAELAGGPFDTLAALRAVEQADAAVDEALAHARQDRERQDRATALLDQAMLLARSSVTAAEDFIATRRGGVGAQARTRLAEAQRHFQQAIAFAQHDPRAALAEAEHADVLAQQARALAEQDVGRFRCDQPARAGGGSEAGLGGARLGGILIDSLPGGGRRGYGGPGGGLGPGSFGGVGTRGRHSIGGRF